MSAAITTLTTSKPTMLKQHSFMKSLLKQKKHFLFFLIFCCSERAVYSQQPIYVRHDFLSNKTVYYQLTGNDTVWIAEPKAKKQQQFIIDVYNINTFHYNSSITLDKRTEDAANSKNIFAPFNLFVKTYGGAFTNILPLLERVKSTRGKAGSDQQFKALQLFEAFNSVYERIRQDDAFYRKLKTNETYLLTLKHNLTKTEEEIKQDADNYMNSQFPALATAWKQKKQPDLKTDMYMKLRLDSAKQLFDALTALRTEAKVDFELDDQTFDGRFQKTGYYYLQVVNLAANEYKNGNEFTQQIQLLYNSYDELMNASFRYSFKADCSNETAGIKLAVFPKASGTDTIYRYFKVNKPTYGFRIRNSVGMAFSFFKEGNRNYFVKLDSTIGFSKGDQFNPLISSYLHFYWANPSAIKVGGTLGVGIPLTKEQSVNFLAGVSLILGKNENFFITGGVAGTKIKKLDKGLQPGDKVPNKDYALPFQSFYDLGGFISIGFNLNMLGGKK